MSKVYKISGNLPNQGIVFRTKEDAEAFLSLGILAVETRYSEGDWSERVVPVGDLKIEEADIPLKSTASTDR